MPQAEWVGWISSVLLIATLSKQVWKQRASHSLAGVSKWLYAGQCAAEVGFVTYSLLLHSWVFVVTNSALLLLNAVGLFFYWQTRATRARGA
jgi:MtN3 and saliva related transmembrane protein